MAIVVGMLMLRVQPDAAGKPLGQSNTSADASVQPSSLSLPIAEVTQLNVSTPVAPAQPSAPQRRCRLLDLHVIDSRGRPAVAARADIWYMQAHTDSQLDDEQIMSRWGKRALFERATESDLRALSSRAISPEHSLLFSEDVRTSYLLESIDTTPPDKSVPCDDSGECRLQIENPYFILRAVGLDAAPSPWVQFNSTGYCILGSTARSEMPPIDGAGAAGDDDAVQLSLRTSGLSTIRCSIVGGALKDAHVIHVRGYRACENDPGWAALAPIRVVGNASFTVCVPDVIEADLLVAGSQDFVQSRVQRRGIDDPWPAVVLALGGYEVKARADAPGQVLVGMFLMAMDAVAIDAPIAATPDFEGSLDYSAMVNRPGTFCIVADCAPGYVQQAPVFVTVEPNQTPPRSMLHVIQASEISGRVVMSMTPDLAEFHIRATPCDRDGVPLTRQGAAWEFWTLTGQVSEAGEFNLPGRSPDLAYLVEVVDSESVVRGHALSLVAGQSVEIDSANDETGRR